MHKRPVFYSTPLQSLEDDQRENFRLVNFELHLPFAWFVGKPYSMLCESQNTKKRTKDIPLCLEPQVGATHQAEDGRHHQGAVRGEKTNPKFPQKGGVNVSYSLSLAEDASPSRLGAQQKK